MLRYYFHLKCPFREAANKRKETTPVPAHGKHVLFKTKPRIKPVIVSRCVGTQLGAVQLQNNNVAISELTFVKL